MPIDSGGFSVDPAVLAARLTTSFHDFFNNIGQVAKTAGETATHIDEDLQDLEAIIADWQELKKNLSTELENLKSFQFDVKWKTRVINVPIAIAQIEDLLNEIFVQVKDKIQEILQAFEDVVSTIKIQGSTAPVVGAGEPTGFARTLNKAENIAGYIRFAFQETRTAFDAAKDVTQLFIDITDRIKKFEDVFLQQGNPRQRTKEASVRRLGKMHRGSAA